MIFNLFSNYINKDIFLCGDFNIDFSTNSNTTHFFNYMLTQLSLSSIINIDTRTTINTNTLIDNIITNSKLY